MMRNLLRGLSKSGRPRHVALVTGLTHYLGPFEAYGRGRLLHTPFREDQGRLDLANFYYAQEDELFEAAASDGFSWSVHRPHTVIGMAVGNAMNMGTTLAVYAALCRETGRPFVFPGSAVQWNGLIDMTDADLLAEHLLWAADTKSAHDEAFNVVNGDVFRWRWMWGRIAHWFGLEPAPFDGTPRPLEGRLSGDADVWRGIAEREGLVEPEHPLFGFRKDAVPIDIAHVVHGGITYAKACEANRFGRVAWGDPRRERYTVCHTTFVRTIQDYRTVRTTENGFDHEDLWWFGFDTSHPGDLVPKARNVDRHDGDAYRDQAFVYGNCIALARKLQSLIRGTPDDDDSAADPLRLPPPEESDEAER